MEWLEELKKILSPEEFQKVESKIGDKKLYLLGKDEYIPKKKFNDELQKTKDVEAKIKQLESDIHSKDEEITKLQKAQQEGDKSTEQKIIDLTASLEKMKEDMKQKDQALELEKKRSVLRTQLTSEKVKANPKYIDDIERKIGKIEDLEIENDGIKGFDDLIKPVLEKFPEMFGEFKIEGDGPAGGGSGNNNLDFTDKEKSRYNDLMKKDTLTPAEQDEAMKIAQKMKTQKKE